MMFRFFFFLFLTICINVWVLREMLRYTTPQPNSSDSVASVSKMYGQVMVRPSGLSEWTELKFYHKLTVGDVVFVGKNSSLVYQYDSEKAKVTLNENSIAEITRTPAVASKVFRNFYKTKSIGEKKSGDGEFPALRKNRIYVRMEQAPTTVRSENGEQKSSDESQGQPQVSIEREAKALRILSPVGDVDIISERSQDSISVLVERPSENTKLFGYLWKKDGGPRPIWTAVQNNRYKFEVPIPEPGEFVFQAMSESDDYISPVVLIKLTRKLEYKGSLEINQSFDVSSWNGKRVLVLR